MWKFFCYSEFMSNQFGCNFYAKLISRKNLSDRKIQPFSHCDTYITTKVCTLLNFNHVFRMDYSFYYKKYMYIFTEIFYLFFFSVIRLQVNNPFGKYVTLWIKLIPRKIRAKNILGLKEITNLIPYFRPRHLQEARKTATKLLIGKLTAVFCR